MESTGSAKVERPTALTAPVFSGRRIRTGVQFPPPPEKRINHEQIIRK